MLFTHNILHTQAPAHNDYTHHTAMQYVEQEYIKKSRLRLKCDVTRPGIRFRLSAKRTNPFKSAGASVQSTTGSRGVRISSSNGSNAG